MSSRRVLALIAGILGVGCHFDSTSGCQPSEQTLRFSLDQICEATGADACSAPKTCEEFCNRATMNPISCKLLGDATTSRTEPFVECTGTSVCKGRKPAGLVQSSSSDAFLEAASVVAFARLSRELRSFGAPRRLVRAARRSRRDEVRHTRMTRRRGEPRPRIAVVDQGARTMLAIAMENAVEGCVRETYGAAVARWQAANVRDPELRAKYQRIARDEARHAVLAHEVDRFFAARLTPTERTQVSAAREAAIASLRAEIAPRENEPTVAVSLAWLELFARA